MRNKEECPNYQCLKGKDTCIGIAYPGWTFLQEHESCINCIKDSERFRARNMKLVRIEWLDSVGAGPIWSTVEELDEKRHICISVGFIALQNDEITVIAPHINDVSKDDLMFCGEMSIPNKCIISTKELNYE